MVPMGAYEPRTLHPLFRKTIKVRCFYCRTAKAGEVTISKIVCQQQNDVRAVVCIQSDRHQQ